jgi:hypothetical protein
MEAVTRSTGHQLVVLTASTESEIDTALAVAATLLATADEVIQ